MGDAFLAAPSDDAEGRLKIDARGLQGRDPSFPLAMPHKQFSRALGVGFVVRSLGPVWPLAEVVVLCAA